MQETRQSIGGQNGLDPITRRDVHRMILDRDKQDNPTAFRIPTPISDTEDIVNRGGELFGIALDVLLSYRGNKIQPGGVLPRHL